MQAIASSWGGGSGTATVELVALDWLRDALGLRADGGGRAVLGRLAGQHDGAGSRPAPRPGDRGVVYVSRPDPLLDRRGALGPSAGVESEVRVLPTDARLPADRRRRCAAAVDADLPPGCGRPCVVAHRRHHQHRRRGRPGRRWPRSPRRTAVAARRRRLRWPGRAGRGPQRDRGLERADSFVLDPHKWLFQPYDLGCVWVSRPGALERTFAMHPEYLADAQSVARGRIRDRPAQPRLRAVASGARGQALADPADLRAGRPGRGGAAWDGARRAAESVVSSRGRARGGHARALGVVTFAVAGPRRRRPPPGRRRVTADGFAAVSSTVLSRRTVLRLCTINPATTDDDVRRTVALLADVGARGGRRGGGDGSSR